MTTKTLTLIILAISVISLQTSCKSCKSSNQNNVPIEALQTEELSEITAIELTRNGFIENVYDFVSSPTEFKYIGKEPAIIDLYATWCGPCKIMSPIIEAVAKEYKGKITVYKIDVDKEPDLAEIFKISSIPTLIYISKDGVINSTVGKLTKEQLEANIEKYLSK